MNVLKHQEQWPYISLRVERFLYDTLNNKWHLIPHQQNKVQFKHSTGTQERM